MRRRIFTVLGSVLACATAASAQSWDEAYKQGDYTRAAALLQPLVFEHTALETEGPYADTRALQTLGLMYAGGLGVPHDPVMACALLGVGSGAAVYQFGEAHDVTASGRKLMDEHCTRLSADERQESVQLAGCFRTGPETQVLRLAPAYAVEVSRATLRIRQDGRQREHELGDLIDCAQQVPLIRHRAVAPPKGSRVPVRHFLEVFAWRAGARQGRHVRALEWRALEIKGTELIVAVRAVLDVNEDTLWADVRLPAAAAHSPKLRMLRNGDVRWEVTGPRQAAGVITPSGGLRRISARRQP